ncbi:MAG TPA: MJ0042-type zinc finger domain-containing protein [Caulobacteraceae bacterium]|nr:MJ0042-type zinc finger domain-containing protein [Caulobacteraceae bacterium]
MILSCPSCATDYFIADGALGPAGRQVRCAACGRRWRADRAHLKSALPAADREATQEEASGRTGAGPAEKVRRRLLWRRRLKSAALSGAAAGAAALTGVVLVGAGLIWREPVARAVPATAGVYALLGLPVNRIGLVIEGVRAEPTLQNGHAALAVTGTIRSVIGASAPAPPLRITLLNAHGAPLTSRIAAPGALNVPAGGSRRFALAILDPPMAAHDLEISFAPKARPGERARIRPLAAPPSAPAAPLDLKGPLDPPPPPPDAGHG